MWLYQLRLMRLEGEFEQARENLKEVQLELRESSGVPDDPDKKLDRTVVKLRLDTITGFVRLIKEQASFYLKLGETYDMVRFAEDLVDELGKIDPKLCERLMKIIDERWHTDLWPQTAEAS